MRARHAVAAVVVLAGASTAEAVDPLVYRECLSQCRQFKDRACCHETCSYTACIADKTKASTTHGTRSGGIRTEQVDPGAWSAAMAACYPWITILQDCGGGKAGTPPAQDDEEEEVDPAKEPPTGRVVLRLVGPPQPTATNENWTTVASGQVVHKGHDYGATYSWGALPEQLGEGGTERTFELQVNCRNGQGMGTGLTISGDVELVGPENTQPTGRVDFPANCASTAGTSRTVEGGGTVKIRPRKGYAPGTRVEVKVGVFYGPHVSYTYEAVRR